MIRPIEMREMATVWVGTACSDEYGGNAWVGCEVEGECVAEGDYGSIARYGRRGKGRGGMRLFFW